MSVQATPPDGGKTPSITPSTSLPGDAVGLAGALVGLWARAHDSQADDISDELATILAAVSRRVTGDDPPDTVRGVPRFAAVVAEDRQMVVSLAPVAFSDDPSPKRLVNVMAHTIRYGEWLCRVYPQWAHALPACWVEHDDIVQEVYALSAFAHQMLLSGTGGADMPVLQRYSDEALQRIQKTLGAAGLTRSDHAHHMDDEDSRTRASARQVEYDRWLHRASGILKPAQRDMLESRLFDFPHPSHAGRRRPADQEHMLGQARVAAHTLDDARRILAGTGQGSSQGMAEDVAEDVHRDVQAVLDEVGARWEEYRAVERREIDRLRQEQARAVRWLRERAEPDAPYAGDGGRVVELNRRASALLDMVDGPDPATCRIDEVRALADGLNEATGMHDHDPVESLDRLVTELARTFPDIIATALDGADGADEQKGRDER